MFCFFFGWLYFFQTPLYRLHPLAGASTLLPPGPFYTPDHFQKFPTALHQLRTPLRTATARGGARACATLRFDMFRVVYPSGPPPIRMVLLFGGPDLFCRVPLSLATSSTALGAVIVAVTAVTAVSAVLPSAMPLAAALSKYNDPAFMSEPSLALDLKYLLLGTDSSSFRFANAAAAAAASYSLRVDIVLDVSILHQNQLGYLREFVQLALLVKRLSLETSPSSSSSSSATVSAATQAPRPSLLAFNACVAESLLSFQQSVNNLYNTHELKHLAALRYHLDDWFTTFRHIYWLYLQSKTQSSHEFLSTLHQQSLVGDSFLQQISLHYYVSSFKPYLKIINNWLLLGSLTENESTREDFFIKHDESRKDFVFFPELTPSFIKPKTSLRIYQIGKTISFLKLYLNDKQWCNDYYNHTSKDSLAVLDDSVIAGLYETVISRLDLLLLDSYQSEIKYLEKFLLLGQGDLIQAIVENGSLLLNEPSSNLSSNQLVTLLQDSIEATSVSQNLGPDVYNRLDARLLNINPASSLGWDLFTLDFKLSPPVEHLILPTYKEYLKVFNFLFKISKLNYQLSKSWKNSHLVDNRLKMNYKQARYPSSRKWNRKMKIYQRKFDLIRHQFISFISSIYSYITNEILSENYYVFCQNFSQDFSKGYDLKNNKLLPLNSNEIKLYNLDELKSIHQNYIFTISKSKLFHNANDTKIPLSRILYQLFLIIEKFSQLYAEFQSTVADLLRIKQLILLEPASDLEQYQTTLIEKIDKIFDKLGSDIVDHFENDLTLLINLLKASNDQSLKCLGQILEN